MTKSLHFILATILLGLLAACGGSQGPEVTPIPSQAEAESSSDSVTLLRQDGSRESLTAPNQTLISVGEGVGVDDTGRAVVRFRDTFAVEIVRRGDIAVETLDVDEQSVFVSVRQRGGATVNNFNAQDVVDARFEVKTEFATITATGTRFTVVKEADSPLWWVVGLEAEAGDLQVESKGEEKNVMSSQARWLAPVGPPSEPVQADMAALERWLENARAGRDQPEVGEVLWPQADVLANTRAIRSLPEPGQPFELQGVVLTLDPDGLFGNPQYALEDCNDDGINDIAMVGGRLRMDFRPLPERVRALDLTIINRDRPGAGSAAVFDPAVAEMARQAPQVGDGDLEVLSFRSQPGQPYHYAELSLGQGCFLGFSLTPPGADNQPGDPRPAAELAEATATSTPTRSTPTRTPTATPTPVAGTLDRRIASGADDVEQRPSDGEMYFDSSDLELGDDEGVFGEQMVGLRFTDIDIPPGSTITAANLEFETDETGSDATSVTIWGEAADDAAPFSSSAFDVSQRAATGASVPWRIPAWNSENAKHRTPDLSAILQEIIDRPGWVENGAVVFVIDGDGRRAAESFEGEPEGAALLHVEFSTSSTRPPRPTRTPTPTGTPTRAPTRTPTATARSYSATFTPRAVTIASGQCAVLSWDVQGVREVYFNGTGAAGQGSSRVCPSQTTTYRLDIVTAEGSQVQLTATVTVDPNLAPPAEPSVVFNAESLSGGCWTVYWDVQNASAVYYEGDGVVGQGSRTECPSYPGQEYVLEVVSRSGQRRSYQVYLDVPSGNPDLLVNSMSWQGSLQGVPEGIRIPLRVQVKNAGSGDAGTFKVAIFFESYGSSYVVPFQVAGSSSQTYAMVPGPLGAGDTVDIFGYVLFPYAHQGESVLVWAEVDSCAGDEFMPAYCRVQESDEGNNDLVDLDLTLSS